jgi:hypothetical protein
VAIQKKPRHTEFVANSGPQGWVPDPFGLHEARYFSAGQSTKLVRDAGVETFDEPPSGPALSTTAVALAAVPARATAGAPGGYATAPDRPWPAAPPFQDGSGRFPRRGPWDGGAWAAIAILAAAALVIGVILVETPKTKPVTTLDTGTAATVAFVSQAAQATLAQRTADMTISGSVQAPGQAAVAIHGAGVMGLSGDAGTLNATYGVPGGMTVEEKEILANGSIYASLSIDGKSEALPGGKTWIQVSMPQARAGTPELALGTDPSSVLAAVEARGETVQALGTKSVDGRVCSGFAISGGVQALVPMKITIWIDSQHLVREMAMSMTLSIAGKAESASTTMDFTSFGGPLQVTAPAPASVIPYAAYMQSGGGNP